MNSSRFKEIVNELVGNIHELANKKYEEYEESNAEVKEKFSYAQIKTLQKMNKFGWKWSSYNNETGVITCKNYKNKIETFVYPDGTYNRG